MKHRVINALASSSLLAIAFTAGAQTESEVATETGAEAGDAGLAATAAAPAAAAADEGNIGVEEIVVTARRKSESLQDIPQTVNAVTSETLEKLNILDFEDVQTVVPGLNLSSGTNGYSTSATIRGASFQPESGATPTVDFYLNDAPTQSIFLFQSMFDVGQIEVLRGPQGTLRGRSAPSGSITVTTRRPDLNESGGYANVTRTNLDALNVQGAFNLPIIDNMLAIRIAGVDDRNRGDQVHSINSEYTPGADSSAMRATLRFEPTDYLNLNVMYQKLDRDSRSFESYQSFHLAEPTATPPDPTLYPVLAASDRLSVSELPSFLTQKQDALTGQLEWRTLGHQLDYVASSYKQDVLSRQSVDSANAIPDFDQLGNVNSRMKAYSHELRISPEETLFGFLEYTVGVFHVDLKSPSDVTQNTIIGIPTGPYTIRAASISQSAIERDGSQEETSFFGNLTFHLGEHTELSAGARKISYKTHDGLIVNGATLTDNNTKEKPSIYNLSLSHRFSDRFMAYINHGTSWRNGADATGIFRPLTPRLTQFTQLDSETSKSYEAGFKADFLDRRLRINASVFRQDYSDFLYRGPSVYYVNLGRQGAVPATFNFVSNVDAVVNGAEVEVAMRPVENLNISATFSYAKGKIEDGVVACNDFDGDGAPDRNPPAPTVDQIRAAAGGEEVGACTVNQPLATAPNWSAVLQPEYTHRVNDRMDGFIRGVYSYYTSTKQNVNNPYDDVDAYGLLNLFTGLRSRDGSWELSVFAKNLLDEGLLLNAGNGPASTGYQQLQPPNYQTAVGASVVSPYMGSVRYTAPREVGAAIRYSFGSF